MPEKPPEMYKNSRPKIRDFKPNERLYRRVSPEDWGDPHPEIDAIDLPNMSVNRGKPIGEPHWVLLESDEYQSWGIVYFEVQSIPSPLLHSDGGLYTFRAEHVPLEANYPHSEVWAFLILQS